jgi:hypothetical protein
MTDYSESGAVPVEDAAVENPPTVDEVVRRQREMHPQQADSSMMNPRTTEAERVTVPADGEPTEHRANTTTLTATPPDRDELLRIYLADHRAGSVGGLGLARRMGSSNHRHAVQLEVLAQELAESQRDLDRVMTIVGSERSSIKDAVAAIGERIGRLKANGRITGRSPLTDVVELELLSCGLAGQRQLWRALRELGDELPVEVGEVAATRLTLVEDQISRVDAWHQDAIGVLGPRHSGEEARQGR